MRKLMLMICLTAVGSFASVWAEPAPVDNAVAPCDDVQGTQKPSCDADADSLKVPAPLPNEGDSVITPPEPPSNGLPHPGKGDPGLPRPTQPPQP